ncbi:MAG: aminoglycoside phosphotransferase family protein, partial [Actinobacteria bacterium]|nr:aminoglycoside phosphotransferase family protein [Actinomycetota bacterium]
MVIRWPGAAAGGYGEPVLAPPADLPEAALVAALERSWGITAVSVGYRPFGWGSHHWEVAGQDGSRWFVTADDLEAKRWAASDTLAAAFARLRASLATARALRDCGRSFVVAPVPAGDGEPLARLGDSFAVAVYPFIEGESFGWGEFASPEHRRSVLRMLVAVHTAPAEAARHGLADDFILQCRGELEAACRPGSKTAGPGPYARPLAALIRRHTAILLDLLARYDGLVAQARSRPGRTVLTHGEPHPGNTMQTGDGWLLIDWDTALLAPPERDLWSLDPGDGSILAAYAAATGIAPRPSLLEAYRLRWDLTDIALEVSRFRRPHAGDANDDKAWHELNSLLAR